MIDKRAAQNIIDFAGRSRGVQPARGVSHEPPSPATQSEIATEGGHWYLQDGTPYYTVIGKNGKERPVTLRDARKVNAYPSTTTVLRVVAKDGLNQYFEREIFEAVLELEWDAGDDKEALFKRVKEASRRKGRIAAERGDKLHGAIEKYLHGGYSAVHPDWLDHVQRVIDALALFGIDLDDGEPEKSFAHPLGYGGKCDWHKRGSRPKPLDGSTIRDFIPSVILDFKSKDQIEDGKKLAYDEHAIQIASYREGLLIPHARGINVFVGVNDKKVFIHEWTEADLQRGWEQFQLLLRFWQLSKNYTPEPNN